MRQRRTPYAVLVAVAGTALVLGGCGGTEHASPPPGSAGGSGALSTPTGSSGTPSTSASTSATSSSASPSSTSAPTSMPGGAGAPGVPPAARQHTDKGAEAFARHYVELINETGVKPVVGTLEPLAADSCKSCANYADNVTYLISHKQHNSGVAARIHRTASEQQGSQIKTWVLLDQLPIAVLDRHGDVVKRREMIKDFALVFNLTWHRNGWQIEEIFVDEQGNLPS